MSTYKLSCTLPKKEINKRIYNYNRLVNAIKEAESQLRIAWVWLECARDEIDIKMVKGKVERIMEKLAKEVEKE